MACRGATGRTVNAGWLCLGACSVAVILLCNQAQHVSASKIKVEGGWTEVRKDWPLESEDYFVATEKGHHFIELRDIPANLDGDLDVHLEYYYSYSRARPVVQMIPCRSNIYLVDEHSEESSNRWLPHDIVVHREDCIKRNELAYNVLLHDAGDVFAWRVVTVRTVPYMAHRKPLEPLKSTNTSIDKNEVPLDTEDNSGNKNSSSNASGTPKDPIEPQTGSEVVTPETKNLESPKTPSEPQEELANLIDEEPNGEKEPKNPEPTKPASPSGDEPERAGQPAQKDDESVAKDKEEKEDRSQAEKDAEATLKEASNKDSQPESKHEEPAPEDKDSETVQNETKDEIVPKERNEEAKQSEQQPAGERSQQKEIESKKPASNDIDGEPTRSEALPRYKRMASGGRDMPQKIWEECRPSKCDRNKFKIDRFSALISGVPKLPVDVSLESYTNKFFLNLNDRPLKMKLDSTSLRVNDVDSCLRFQLFMEKDTELELLLEEPQSKSTGAKSNSARPRSERILEVIKRKATDSSVGNWEQFQRCISDYMPKLELPEGGDNSIRFVFKPKADKPGIKPGQMAMLLSTAPDQASYLSPLFPIQSYLPDVRLISDPSTLNKFWVIDRDGLKKPKLELKGKLNGSDRTLEISDIDPSQDFFDITSRWMAIKDAELLEQPVLLVYRARKVDWVKQVDLQYQRAGGDYNDWISQVAYKAPLAAAAEQNQTTDSSSNATTTQQVDSSETQRPLIDMPIRLKGLDSSEFRVRIRHHLAPEKVEGKTPIHSLLKSARSLEVRTLALADACTYRPKYCLNGGMCKPTGPAQAECLCLQGYSGDYCEHKKPCEMLYGDRTGRQICESVGARCVPGLPEMRCEWPNDKFYKCQRLFQLDANGQYNSSTTVNQFETGETSGSRQPSDGKMPNGGTAAGVLGGVGKLVDGRELEALPKEEQISVLKGAVNQQAKLVIILAVFIVAILVFTVVLIGSMVARLRKSSRRLKRSQSDIQQMARRVSEAPGNSGLGTTSFGRGAPAGRVGFNNSAFDVE